MLLRGFIFKYSEYRDFFWVCFGVVIVFVCVLLGFLWCWGFVVFVLNRWFHVDG